MPAIRAREKGVALFVVMAVVLVAIMLAGAVLNLMLSQTRLTHHQVSRIQAFYAAQAGMNYAFDKLRRKDDPNWPSTGPYTRILTDPDFPPIVKNVTITVGAPGGGIGGTSNVTAKADYTYSAP